MPIYEFRCDQCNAKFEQLCRLNWEGTVKCPACGRTNITKIISQISSHGRQSGENCASCSGKSCSGCK